MKEYSWINPTAASAWTNTAKQWAVVIGVSFGSTGTVGANTVLLSLIVKDSSGNQIDAIYVIGENYVAAPATAGNIYLSGVLKKLLVPPGGSVTPNTALTGNFSIIICNADTLSESLQMAVAIL